MGQGFISKYILRGIADFIRGRKNTTAEIKPVDMVAELESIPTFEQGKQAEYDRFWDTYQDYGKRTAFPCSFGGNGWYGNFRPKYDIRPTDGYMMFRSFGMINENGNHVSLKSVLDELGIVLDFSNCTNLQYAFQWANPLELGVVDLRSLSQGSNMFAYANIFSIEELILYENTKIDSFFSNVTKLRRLKVSGVIAKNGFNVQWATLLDHDSIVSIINCLSTTTSGLSITLSKTAVENAFTDEEWTELEQTKPNWTIVLV